jgi:hypothetical protein
MLSLETSGDINFEVRLEIPSQWHTWIQIVSYFEKNTNMLGAVTGNPSSCPPVNPGDRWRQEIASEELIQRARMLQFSKL